MFRCFTMAFAFACTPIVANGLLYAADDPVASEDPFGNSESGSHTPPAKTASVAKTEIVNRPKEKPVAAEDRIRAALRETTTMEFIQTPLSDVVDYLKDLHKIEIQFDGKALEDAGAGSDTPVTQNLKGISLCSALRLLFKGLDLTYIIQNEVLLITTPEKAASMMEVRLYDVHDLAAEPKNASSTKKLEALRDTVRNTISPHSWKDAGGPGALEIFTRDGVCALVVMQSFDGHEQIDSLLTNLRKLQPH